MIAMKAKQPSAVESYEEAALDDIDSLEAVANLAMQLAQVLREGLEAYRSPKGPGRSCTIGMHMAGRKIDLPAEMRDLWTALPEELVRSRLNPLLGAYDLKSTITEHGIHLVLVSEEKYLKILDEEGL